MAGFVISGGVSAAGWAMKFFFEKPPEWFLCMVLVFSGIAIAFGVWLIIDFFVKEGSIKLNLKLWKRYSLAGEIWITDAFKLIAQKNLGADITDIQILKSIGDTLDKFRHYASRGELRIYGSVSIFDKHTRLIPAEYWNDNQIDIFSAMKGKPEETKTEVRHGNTEQKYYGLKVEAKEIKQLKWN